LRQQANVDRHSDDDRGGALGQHDAVIDVRAADEADGPRILELLSQLFDRDMTHDEARATSLRRMLDSERGAVLVAFEDDVVHGVITFSCNLAVRFDTAYAQIEELVVDSAARGRHVGAALVRAAMREATERGCDEMGLYPREETRPFYEGLGFEYVGVELRQRLR
jgi:predicted N-acetyltransferase YhbS